jgi:hypothetical protein
MNENNSQLTESAESPTMDERVKELEERLARLENRFQSMLEVNELWDGS